MKSQDSVFSLWTSKHSQRNAIAHQSAEQNVTPEEADAIRGAFLKKVDDERLHTYKTVHNETALARLFG